MPFAVFNQKSIARGTEDPSWCDEIVHVSRPSVLGNPFPIGNGPNSSRDEVIRRYERYLADEFKWNKEGRPMQEVVRLAKLHAAGKSVALVCHCAPLPCHASVVIRAVLSAAAEFSKT